MRHTTSAYSASDREYFRDGTLWKQWAQEYPSAFDVADLRLIAACAPRGRLFCEWFVAVHYIRQGYRILGEYQFAKAHRPKSVVFRRVASPPVVDLLMKRRAFGSRQGPDLSVYSNDERDWFFAEVKGPGDTLSPGQIELFKESERRSRR